MKTVSIAEARKNLSRLVDQAVLGEGFIISRRGRPLVQVTAVDTPALLKVPLRVGFMRGQITVPVDFDTMASDEIAALFDSD